MTYLDPKAGQAREPSAGNELDTILDNIPQAAEANATAITGGESPTEAEYNALVTKINNILTKLRAAGIITS